MDDLKGKGENPMEKSLKSTKMFYMEHRQTWKVGKKNRQLAETCL